MIYVCELNKAEHFDMECIVRIRQVLVVLYLYLCLIDCVVVDLGLGLVT